MHDSGQGSDRLRLVFGGCAALCIALVLLASREVLLSDPDIWWHVRTGQWIWESRSFPTTDTYSFTFAGHPWIAKEWLSQMLFFAAYGVAGWNGVSLLAWLAIVLAAAILYRSIARDLAPGLALGLTVAGLMLASSAFVARPHVLTIPIAIFWTDRLFGAAQAGRAPPPALLLMIILWANLHGAFTLGFVIAFCAFVDCALRLRTRRPDVVLGWVVFLALCPLASLVHPYGWKAMLASWWIAGPNTSVPLITEWQPLVGHGFSPQEIALLGALLASLVTGFRLAAGRALLVALLVHLAFTHARFVLYLFPLLFVLVAPDMARQFPRLSALRWRAQPSDRLERAVLRRDRPVLAVLAGGLVLAALVEGVVLRSTPPLERALAGALAAVKTQGITGHVFNDYDFGGPLIFYRIPTFIDGRSEQLFLGSFAATFMLGPRSATALADAFATYDISWTLLPAGDPRNALIEQLPHWRRAYADSTAVVFHRMP